ncbi:MAG: menaquinol-cytochrome C reductase [Candidatus Methylomirabilis oxyfera]|nr:menaquinol-cytochrome C reductase [Candidatus Methylomirabilis oxyfera]
MQVRTTGKTTGPNGGEDRVRIAAIVKVQGEVPALQREPDDTVMTWPHLVVWEFIAAMVFILALLAVSWLVNAPLVDHANADLTPNPAKAPWYFLNLQELLLHMHPSLAGVIVPGLLLLWLMTIPYLDNTTEGAGQWFTSRQGARIALFSSVFAAVLVPAMVAFDEYLGVRRSLTPLGVPAFVIESVIPVALMVGFPALLLYLVRLFWGQVNRREKLIALFFGFVATYLVLTIIGTAFRGTGMHLFWPWDMPPAH